MQGINITKANKSNNQQTILKDLIKMQTQNGLKGGGWFRKLLKGIATVATVFGGPAGATIGAVIAIYLTATQEKLTGDIQYSENETRLDKWLNTQFLPFTEEIFRYLSEESAEAHKYPEYILKVNNAMQKLSVLQAYYEYKKVKSKTPQDEEMYRLQAEAVGLISDEIRNAYLKVVPEAEFVGSNFKASAFKNIGDIPLNWGLATVVTATKYHVGSATSTSTPKGGGDTNTPSVPTGTPTAPDTGSGNTETPKGGSTPTTGGGYETPPYIPEPTPTTPPTTGGNTGGNTGGGTGGSTNAPSKPEPRPKNPKGNDNNSKTLLYVLGGIGVYFLATKNKKSKKSKSK